MKKATLTPNRFIISTPSWSVKGIVLFFALLLFGACEDQLEGIGSKKELSRFKVQYREFDIPVTTVQTDSINTYIGELGSSDRLFCGIVDDPIFGITTATIYTQFGPAIGLSPKIDQTNKSNFQYLGAEMELVLTTDYYEYGDTSDVTLGFTLHQIKPEADFWPTNKYVASSTVDHEATVLASGSYFYKRDSIVKHRTENADADTNYNPHDTLQFQLPASLGKALMDTALAKGVYSFNTNDEWVFNPTKTDSVFRRQFPGFVIKPAPTNDRILSFKAGLAPAATSTRIIVYYSYIKDGATVNSQLVYYNYYGSFPRPGFTNITYDRTNTALSGITQTGVDYDAPDDYCYMQSGTGLFAKLDFSGVRAYFDATPDTLPYVALNGAELMVELEPDVTRQHLARPNYMHLRVMDEEENNFLKAPLVLTTSGYTASPLYTAAYYSIGYIAFLDAVDDTPRRASIAYTKKTTGEQYYSLFLTDFFSKFLRPTEDFTPITHMALIPGAGPNLSSPFGKSFNGVSFKKDKVKLRIYYTKTL